MVVVVAIPGPEGTSEVFMVLPQHCHCVWGNQGLKIPSKPWQSWTHTHLFNALLRVICLLCLAREQRQRKVCSRRQPRHLAIPSSRWVLLGSATAMRGEPSPRAAVLHPDTAPK